MRTSFYIDGFNFYYGCFKQTPSRCSPADKWLDWRSLAEMIAGPDARIHKLYYFTAIVHYSKDDPEQNLRQETYFRALRTVPGIEIAYGTHLKVTRRGELISPTPHSLNLEPHKRVTIRTFEEKGSDVNLATQLLDDSYSGDVEHAIVVSNDSDLVAPIKSARRRVRVSVVSPYPTLSKQLRRAANAGWILDLSLLSACRLRVPTIDPDGREIYPPRSWSDSVVGTLDEACQK